jgi:hypothetical protein
MGLTAMRSEPQIDDNDLASTTERLLAGAGVALMTTGTAFAAYFDPSKSNFFPVCPLYAMTGFACPGCGLTRGFHSLIHGDIIPALDFNLLIPVWAVVLGWVFVSLLLLTVRGRGLPMWPTWPRFLWAFMIALWVFGVLRNIPAWPFTILFP